MSTGLLVGLTLDEFFSRSDPTSTAYYSADAVGSIVALTDTSGSLQTAYTYEPFGTTSATGAASSNPYDFTGREGDLPGLKYYRARHYHPGLSRFISEDPIGLFGGPNLYTYVANSPLAFSDPLGLYVIVRRYRGYKGNPFGHIGIAVNTCWTLGFYGDDSLSMYIGDPVSGHVAPDFGHELLETIVIDTTLEEDRLVAEFIRNRIANPGTYTFGGRNCAAFVSDALSAADLKTNGSVLPFYLMQDIKQRYGGSPAVCRQYLLTH